MTIDALNAIFSIAPWTIQVRARVCDHLIDMPRTIPYAVVNGAAGAPKSVTLPCPYCGREAEFPLHL